MTAPAKLALPLRVSEHGAILDANGKVVVYTIGVHNAEAAAIVAAVNRLAEVERERYAFKDELAKSPVECSCHPGVRWPSIEWGQECKITRLERVARDMAEALRDAEVQMDNAAELLTEGSDTDEDAWATEKAEQLTCAAMNNRTTLAAWDALTKGDTK